MQLIGIKSLQEFPCIEAVLCGMAKHTLEKKISVKGGIDLFKIKKTSGFGYPADLSNAAAPVKHVMDDAEIHYSIKARILKWEIFSIAHMIGNLLFET